MMGECCTRPTFSVKRDRDIQLALKKGAQLPLILLLKHNWQLLPIVTFTYKKSEGEGIEQRMQSFWKAPDG